MDRTRPAYASRHVDLPTGVRLSYVEVGDPEGAPVLLLLILWGERDAFCPRRAQDGLLAAIAGSRLVVYEGAGHALHWEEPARFAADLVAHVSVCRVGSHARDRSGR